MENVKNCMYFDQCNHKDCNEAMCIRKYKTDNLFEIAFIPENQRVRRSLKIDADGTDFAEFKLLSELETNILDFVKSGQNLFLHSVNTGNGKTSWALRLIQAYILKIWARSDLSCCAMFISVPRLLVELKNNISEKSKYIEHIKKYVLVADLIVWDDIGTKIGTEFEISQLLTMIDSRITLGKSNIYTSNLNYNGLVNSIGERLASRVCYASRDIELKGRDKRNITTSGSDN